MPAIQARDCKTDRETLKAIRARLMPYGRWSLCKQGEVALTALAATAKGSLVQLDLATVTA